MKKTLIAVAALAATSAFAQVTIDGLVDVGYRSTDNKGDKRSGIDSNAANTSSLNLRATEDLGGGLKANLRLETNFNANTDGTPFANGEQRFGLSGAFGAVDFGRVNYTTLSVLGLGSPNGVTNVGGAYGSVTATCATGAASTATGVGGAVTGCGALLTVNPLSGSNGVRSTNAVKYTSPSLSGFQASLYHVNKDKDSAAAANNRPGNTEVAAWYVNGPISVGVANLKTDAADTAAAAAGTDNKYSNTTIAGNYVLGAFTIYGLNQTLKNGNDDYKRVTTTLGAKYTFGTNSVFVKGGTAKDKGAQAANNESSKLMVVGYDYAMSKRTTAYLRYEAVDDKAQLLSDDINGNQKRTITALGLRHTF